MAVTTDIAAMYRRPRAVIRDRLAPPRREDRALGYVLVACLLLFVAQAPSQARQAYIDPSVPVEARLYWSGLFYVFMLPLALYLLAAISHLAGRLTGGGGSFHGARVALFWALLASVPLWLLAGLTAGFVGPGPAQVLTAGLAAAAFVLFWTLGLAEDRRAGGVTA